MAEECGPGLNAPLDGAPDASAESTSPVPAKAGPLRFLVPSPERAPLLSQNIHPGHATRTSCATRARAALQIAKDACEVRSSDTRLQDSVRSRPRARTSDIPDLPEMFHLARREAVVAVCAIASAQSS